MKNIAHKVTHHFQPTNNTCGYAALAILLSHYGKHYKPEELVSKIPQPKDSEGTSHGSVTAQIADWCQTQDYQVHMFVSDLYVLDLSWQGKNSGQIRKRLEEVKTRRKNPLLGEHWMNVYESAYISMLDHGADLTVKQFITSELLYKLLEDGPIYANICLNALSGRGRVTSPSLREDVADDIQGSIYTHSVVIYGNDEEGNFLIADPWDGLIVNSPEQLVLAIEAAQIECDNQIFVLKEGAAV